MLKKIAQLTAMLACAFFLFVAPASAIKVLLRDMDGDPLFDDARWQTIGYAWTETDVEVDIGTDGGDYLFYFYGKNVEFPAVVERYFPNPSVFVETNSTFHFPVYSNLISVIISGASADSEVVWSCTSDPAAMTNSTS